MRQLELKAARNELTVPRRRVWTTQALKGLFRLHSKLSPSAGIQRTHAVFKYPKSTIATVIDSEGEWISEMMPSFQRIGAMRPDASGRRSLSCGTEA